MLELITILLLTFAAGCLIGSFTYLLINHLARVAQRRKVRKQIVKAIIKPLKETEARRHMTNGDRIRQMSDEELSEVIDCPYPGEDCKEDMCKNAYQDGFRKKARDSSEISN